MSEEATKGTEVPAEKPKKRESKKQETSGISPEGLATAMNTASNPETLQNIPVQQMYPVDHPEDVQDRTIEDRKEETLNEEKKETAKTVGNTDTNSAKKNVKDIVFWGNGDTFKLISKASSQNEGWMKSTKAMEIEKVGCVVQVTTQQGHTIAEAVTFVPGCKIEETKDEEGNVISRRLVHLGHM